MRKFDGFTLVELVVVIAILGILAAVAVPAYTGYIEKTHMISDQQVCTVVETAAQSALASKGTIAVLGVELRTDTAADDEIWATCTDGNAYYFVTGTVTNDAAGKRLVDPAVRGEFAALMEGNHLPASFRQTGVSTAVRENNIWVFSRYSDPGAGEIPSLMN